MRILLTCDPELPVPPENYGGVQRIVAELLQEFSSRGASVALLAHSESSAQVEKRFAWPISQSQGLEATLKNTRALKRAVVEFNPDVLHSFSRLAYLLPVLSRSLPKIMSYQRRPGARQVSFASKIAGKSLHFTGCSQHISKTGAGAGGRWSTVYNCVNLDLFTFAPQVAQNAPLVFLSRLERIKGVHTAIAIAKRANRKLIIAGNRVSAGGEPDYFENEIEPHLQSDLIEYVGEVNDLQKNELLGQAAALLVPIEWQEPFGIVFAEALACGTPVISTNCGSVPEIIEDGVHGFVISNAEEGADAVRDIENLDRKACRERAENLFSHSTIATQYLELYRSCLQEGAD